MLKHVLWRYGMFQRRLRRAALLGVIAIGMCTIYRVDTEIFSTTLDMNRFSPGRFAISFAVGVPVLLLINVVLSMVSSPATDENWESRDFERENDFLIKGFICEVFSVTEQEFSYRLFGQICFVVLLASSSTDFLKHLWWNIFVLSLLITGAVVSKFEIGTLRWFAVTFGLCMGIRFIMDLDPLTALIIGSVVGSLTFTLCHQYRPCHQCVVKGIYLFLSGLFYIALVYTTNDGHMFYAIAFHAGINLTGRVWDLLLS